MTLPAVLAYLRKRGGSITVRELTYGFGVAPGEATAVVLAGVRAGNLLATTRRGKSATYSLPTAANPRTKPNPRPKLPVPASTDDAIRWLAVADELTESADAAELLAERIEANQGQYAASPYRQQSHDHRTRAAAMRAAVVRSGFDVGAPKRRRVAPVAPPPPVRASAGLPMRGAQSSLFSGGPSVGALFGRRNPGKNRNPADFDPRPHYLASFAARYAGRAGDAERHLLMAERGEQIRDIANRNMPDELIAQAERADERAKWHALGGNEHAARSDRQSATILRAAAGYHGDEWAPFVNVNPAKRKRRAANQRRKRR